jgi:hypothetical protein
MDVHGNLNMLRLMWKLAILIMYWWMRRPALKCKDGCFCLFPILFILGAEINHMSGNVASLPVHHGSHIRGVFFMPNLLADRSSFSSGEGVDNTAKASASWPTITITTLVNANPLEIVTTGQPIISGNKGDVDLPCAFSATSTPLEGFGEANGCAAYTNYILMDVQASLNM